MNLDQISARTVRMAGFVACLAAGLGQGAHAGGPEVHVATLNPVKDNTLIEIEDGSLSNGLGEFVFAGRVGTHAEGGMKLRRGLMKFDIAAALPSGAIVQSVTLDVFCVMTNTGPHVVDLLRALKDWGEGASAAPGGSGAPATPGDATWLHAFWPDDAWSNPGGDFAETPSATTIIGFAGAYQWDSTPELVADVQSWLDDPSTNFGWLVRGDEPFVQSVKALASRENVVESQRPLLTILYTVRSSPLDLDGNGVVDGGDLGVLLSTWGSCPPSCPADLDGSGAVDGADLGVFLDGWGGA